ncbi:MAG: glycosyltransferase [Verrucomicrobiia bacterium]
MEEKSQQTLTAKRTLKILHVVLSLEPGGMENGVVNVAQVLHGNGFDIYVCCLEKEGDFAQRLPDRSKLFVLNKPQGISIKTAFRLSKLIRKIQPQIVHSHNFGPLIYSSFAKFISPDFKFLHGEHGMIKKEDCGKFKILLRRLCYKRCDLIHTVSEGLKKYFVEQGFPERKIIAIKNGVDTERFKPQNKQEARRLMNIHLDAVVLGIVGRFDTGKRHLALLQAFEQLADKNKDLHLLMVGDGGTDCKQVKDFVNASLFKNRIILAGYQKNPVPFYQSMDLLVIPSLKEGFPNVLLESMACGVPVLAHPTPGTAETIDPGLNGIIANLEKTEDLKKAIELAISDVGRLEIMGKNARIKIERSFSLQSMAEAYAEVYRKLATEG